MDLNEYLVGMNEPRDIEAREAFRVDDDPKAAWAMRKIARAREERAKIRVQYEETLAQMDRWASMEDGVHAREEAWATNLLEDYARQQRALGRKSINTPSGSIASRAGTTTWAVDDTAFVEWAKANHPDWLQVVTTEKRPTVADLKSLLTAVDSQAVDEETGEVVPGVTLTPTGLRFTIST